MHAEFFLTQFLDISEAQSFWSVPTPINCSTMLNSGFRASTRQRFVPFEVWKFEN